LHDFKQLFHKHIESLSSTTAEALKRWGYSSVVIDAGTPFTYYADDQQPAFVATPHFSHWCPVSKPHCLVQYTPGSKPRLLYFFPDDFWHEQEDLGQPFWIDEFDVVIVKKREDIWKQIAGGHHTAYIGPNPNAALACSLSPNPSFLVAMLNWQRSLKTEYEVTCISEANRQAAAAHRVARECFLNGGSELDIYYAYLQTLNAVDSMLPYNAIVCLDEKGAFLHYESKQTKRDGKVLLIDAGARTQNYCSDITRTHTTPDCHKTFQSLIAELDKKQLMLCDQAKHGLPYPELHLRSHRYIFEILESHGILKSIQEDEAIDRQLTWNFYPHGLGHQLGIQVHDVAGQQADCYGAPGEPHDRFPKLRTTRTLETGMVITIEPGIYFIKSLLDKARNSDNAKHFDWKLIDELSPCGGIRIEDNILIQGQSTRNLTREHL
jgi:Xaa-Pro dipeptidase